LAAVSAVFAEHDANIVSIDVHEIDRTSAVDEIVVDVPEGWIPSNLAMALAESAAGTLLSSRSVTTPDDAVTVALKAVAAMVTGDVDTACTAAVLRVASGAKASLVNVDEADYARSGSVVTRVEHGWQLAAVDDETDPWTVAIVSRPLNVRFSATEISRVEALLRIRRRLLAARSMSA
jgi:hypothetical protein